MAITRIMPQAGIVKDDPEYAAQGAWVSADKVRFRLGKPEKIGGYENYRDGSLIGIARGMHVWDAFDEDRYMGIGTEQRLYIENGGDIFDKTPLRTSVTALVQGTSSYTLATNAGNGGWCHVFPGTDGTARINVSAGHGAIAGDWVAISTAGAVTVSGGSCSIIPNGVHQITSVVDATNFLVVFSVSNSGALGAETTAAGGSAGAHLDMLLPSGTSEAAPLFGWGIDGWGSGGWGAAATESSVNLALRSWSFDNAGEDLFANVRGGGIYHWDKSSANISLTSARAQLLYDTATPTSVEYIYMTPERHLVALGANNVADDGNSFSANFMRVQWSDQEVFSGANSWQPAATNTAGDIVLQGGSKLVAGMALRGVNLIWSDTHLFQQRFSGPPFTFEHQRLGQGGLIGPHAASEHNGIAFWMSLENFHMWTGGAPQPIPCPVRDFVYDRLDFDKKDKIICHVIDKFDEVWWDYPSTSGGGENDSYVVYNFHSHLWFTGTFARTAVGKNTKDNTLFAVHSDKRIMQHEGQGVVDAENSAMGARIISAPMDIGDGDSIALMHTLIPDVILSGGNLIVSTKSRRYPQATLITRSSSTFTSTDNKLDVRVAGRQVQFTFESSGTLGVNWRLGDLRADVQKGGGR